MRRRHPILVRMSLVVALAASLAAVASPAAGQSPAWTLPTGRVTVTYWDGVENVKNELMLKKLIPEYQKPHPNVTIQYEPISGLNYKLAVAFATGTASTIFTLPDLLLPAPRQVNAPDPLPPTAPRQA